MGLTSAPFPSGFYGLAFTLIWMLEYNPLDDRHLTVVVP